MENIRPFLSTEDHQTKSVSILNDNFVILRGPIIGEKKVGQNVVIDPPPFPPQESGITRTIDLIGWCNDFYEKRST